MSHNLDDCGPRPWTNPYPEGQLSLIDICLLAKSSINVEFWLSGECICLVRIFSASSYSNDLLADL